MHLGARDRVVVENIMICNYYRGVDKVVIIPMIRIYETLWSMLFVFEKYLANLQ